MDNNIKNKLKNLSLQSMFNLNQKQLDDLYKSYSNILSIIKKIEDFPIDDNINESSFCQPSKMILNSLRPDDFYDFNIGQDELFQNVNDFKNNMVVLKNDKK